MIIKIATTNPETSPAINAAWFVELSESGCGSAKHFHKQVMSMGYFLINFIQFHFKFFFYIKFLYTLRYLFYTIIIFLKIKLN